MSFLERLKSSWFSVEGRRDWARWFAAKLLVARLAMWPLFLASAALASWLMGTTRDAFGAFLLLLALVLAFLLCLSWRAMASGALSFYAGISGRPDTLLRFVAEMVFSLAAMGQLPSVLASMVGASSIPLNAHVALLCANLVVLTVISWGKSGTAGSTGEMAAPGSGYESIGPGTAPLYARSRTVEAKAR